MEFGMKRQQGKLKRDYYFCTLVEFKFRGIPQRVSQQSHYAFGGRAEIEFKSYALNQDELDLFKDKLNDSDLYSALKLVQGMTDDSLRELKFDIDEFIGDKEKKEKADANPFSALFGFSKKETKSEEDEKKERLEMLKNKGVKRDSYPEAYVRNIAIAGAMDNAYTVYDIFKKSLGMASFPYYAAGMGGKMKKPPKSVADRFFGFK